MVQATKKENASNMLKHVFSLINKKVKKLVEITLIEWVSQLIYKTIKNLKCLKVKCIIC